MTDPTNSSVGHDGADDEGHTGPVVRDRRRLDPETGQVREGMGNTSESDDSAVIDAEAAAVAEAESVVAAASSGDLAAAQTRSEELLGDLQRLNAEYVNYRKRVDRDRDVARESATASVMDALLPVLDEIHLARQHGDLESGPFASIAEKLESTLGRLGLERFGEVGEEFDPQLHEALMHTTAELAEGTTTTTVVQILQPGYRLQSKVLRAARVAVADPA